MMANSSFRALAVPQGEHRVEFRYISETQAAGRLLTLAGLAMVLAGIIIGSVFPGRSRGREE